MLDTKWTPGPWQADTLPTGAFCISDEKNFWTLCERSAWPNRGTQSIANAHLIAAAPELYEALEQAAKKFREYEAIHAAKKSIDGDAKARTNRVMARFCETALAKARGET